MPADAQDEPPPLSAYGELPDIEDMAISPSGERIAVLGRFNGRRLLVVADQNRKPLKTIPIDDIKVRQFELVSDNLLLLRRSTTEKLSYDFAQDKFEFYQALIIPLDGKDPDLVFGNKSGLVKATFGYHGTRLIDGQPNAYFGAIELKRSGPGGMDYEFDHGRPALYAVDLATNKARKIDNSPSPNFDRDWLIDGQGEIAAKLDYSLTTGKWEIMGRGAVVASGNNPTGGIYLVCLGRDGTTVIYSARDETEGKTRWYEVPLDGSGTPVEVYGDVEIERIFVDDRNGQLIGYVKDSDEREPIFFDADKTKTAKGIRTAFAAFNNRMIDWTPSFSHVIVRTDGDGDSGSYFRVDMARLKADPIGWERELIGPKHVGPVSTVAYTAADGLEMDGILTLPPGREAKNLPVVMLPHGGPHSHDIETFDWWAQAFASRGYAVFQPNFRGSTNRDEAFIQAGYGEWGGKMQSDISDGLMALADKGIVDPSRACIVGASYGGYAALAGVTLQQGIYRCAVSVNGVSDVSLMSRIEKREGGGSKVQARSLERQLGPKSRYGDISPRRHAAMADAPILLIHGRDDTVVAYDQSAKMADALKDAGKPYEFLELKGEDHWLSLGETRKTMLEAAVGFVERHNPAK
ncbi:S9 family peptidase [Altererythrobacter sp. BO-6]|uniref:S9 family peptidase n=1 Tax=Altererythrobacter sp. BO-6 TaxID=2604537 RepID=UPI0013E19FD2|nr:prolyl oligopeptidase family serine peptidase [Altererythrobacter sp. BO-6]QIG54182.1 S9 family peptidase [Altererythrobacter sp. BO-6]